MKKVCFLLCSLHHQRVFDPHPLNLGQMPHCSDQQNTIGGTSLGLKKPEVSTCCFLGYPFSRKAAAPLNTCLPLGGVPVSLREAMCRESPFSQPQPRAMWDIPTAATPHGEEAKPQD